MGPDVAVIINPVAGSRHRADGARRHAELVAGVLAAHSTPGEVFITERAGHARDLARAAVARGTAVVVACGGDGTVNEVASVLAFTRTALAIIPTGSGNGLARELQLPARPEVAFAAALAGRERTIDVGELGGRLFVNVAGIGLDGEIAAAFNAGGPRRRGFLWYAAVTLRQLRAFTPSTCTIAADGAEQTSRVLLVALANSRQFGNGAVIAPGARLDDGVLDLVVVAARSPVRVLAQIPRLFTGTVHRAPGVRTTQVRRVSLVATHPVAAHVDGEPLARATAFDGRIHAAALRVRVP